MLSVILPTFNENYNIINLLKELLINKKINEIIIINDCSNDNTVELINNLINNNKIKIIKIIKNKKNLGQSMSILRGVEKAINKIVCIMDSDGQNDPKYIDCMLEKLINSDYDMIMGKRKNRTDTIFKKIQSFVGNKIRNFILNDNCIDSGCGLKLIYKDIYLNLHKINNMHRFIPYLMKIQNFKYCFFEIIDRKRQYGKSNYNIFMKFQSLLELIILYLLWFITGNLRK